MRYFLYFIIFFFSTINLSSTSSDFNIVQLSCDNDLCGIKESIDSALFLNNINVCLVGEMHWREPMTSKLFFGYQKHLYENFGFKRILLEGGKSYANLLNKYITQRNDTDWFLISQSCSGDATTFKRQLDYIYLQNISNGNSIKFIGIDYENNFPVAIYTLGRLLIGTSTERVKNIGSCIKFTIDYYRDINNNRFHNISIDRARELIYNYFDFKSAYKSLLLEHFDEFNLIMDDLYLQYENSIRSHHKAIIEKREKYIYRNCRTAINREPSEKYVGRFGLMHLPTAIKPIWFDREDWKSAAAYLAEDSSGGVNIKINTVLLFYQSVSKKYDMFSKNTQQIFSSLYVKDALVVKSPPEIIQGINTILLIDK
jgi:hypothetical protein